MQIVRSDLGQIYRSLSADAGATWSAPEPMGLTAPTAPSSIARIPSTGDLLMVWNNNKPGAVHTQEPGRLVEIAQVEKHLSARQEGDATPDEPSGSH